MGDVNEGARSIFQQTEERWCEVYSLDALAQRAGTCLVTTILVERFLTPYFPCPTKSWPPLISLSPQSQLNVKQVIVILCSFRPIIIRITVEPIT